MRKRDLNLLIGLITLIVVFVSSPKNFIQNITPDQNPSHTVAPTQVLGEKTVGVIPNAIGASESAQVTRVVDGDTIKVSLNGKQQTVRLIGINTPETVDPRRTVQCFGKEASNKAKEILSGQTVSLEADSTQDNTDKYDRLLRYVWLADGRNFNKVMINEGYAYEYTYDLPYKYQSEFKQAQAEAQNAKKGLWNNATCGGKS